MTDLPQPSSSSASLSSTTIFPPLYALVESLEARVARLELEGQALDKRLAELQRPQDLYPDIGALAHGNASDEEDAHTGLRTTALGVTEIDSLCMQCEKTGVTSLLLTKIPFFKEVILMSFACPHCGHRDSQIQSGGQVQDHGQRIQFRVQTAQDLSRQVVKSETATLRVEDLDFEIPPSRGTISTLEGMLVEAVETLEQTHEARVARDGPDVAAQVAAFASRLARVARGEALPVLVTLDDPAGNSFVDNPHAPRLDPQLSVEWYVRTPEQTAALGLQPPQPDSKHVKAGASLKQLLATHPALSNEDVEKEVLQLPAACPNCRVEGLADNCLIHLPFFKEVIIMAFNCESCGFRDTEIKGGGAITEHGRRDTLRVLDPKVDLSRDVIKSDTAGVQIPELELEVSHGSLGGMYTTVEGLVSKMRDTLFERRIFQGDSSEPERVARFDLLEKQLDACIKGIMPFTLVLEDPLSNSYIYSPFAPDVDPRLNIETYVRSWDEDEELGLHDMRVDDVGYVKDDDARSGQAVMAELQRDLPATHPHHMTMGGGE